MATKVGTGYVDIQGDFSTLSKQVDSALAPLLAKFGALGSKAALGFGAVAAAATAAGAAAFAIGENFDDAYDKIRIGTGKTGKDLKALEGDFKSVVTTVPTNFGNAATAVTALNQKLGLTGKPLRDLSARVLELSRLTGSDLAGTIDSTTKAFNRWGISASNQGPALDKLFRAFENTGVPASKLADELARFGAPLQAFGFSFEQSAALLGSFGKAGLNTSKIMMSLNVALANVAKSGQDPRAVLAGTTEAIKEAGSQSEATGIAIKLFGARSGPELAAAIRSGRLDIESLTATIAGGRDTIMGASRDTQDFSEKWLLFRNRILVGLEPLAIGVFNAVGAAMDVIPGIVGGIVGAFRLLLDPLVSVANAAIHSKTAMLALGGAVAVVAGTFATLAIASVAASAVRALGAAMIYLRNPLLTITLLLQANPFTAAVAAVAALTAAFIVAYRESSRFRAALAAIGHAVSDAAAAVWNTAKGIGASIVNGVLTGVADLYGLLKSSIEAQLVSALVSLNPFSPVSHGGEKYIGRPLGEGALRGWVYGSADLPARMADTVRAAVEKARSSIDALRSKFSAAFSVLAGDALAAFDAVMGKVRTSAELTLDTDDFKRQIKTLANAVADAKSQLGEALSAQAALDPQALADRLAPLKDALAEALDKQAAIGPEFGKQIDDLTGKLLDAKAARDGLTQTQGRTAFDATLKQYVTLGGESDADFAKRKAKAEEDVKKAQDAIDKARADNVKAVADAGKAVAAAREKIAKEERDFGADQIKAAQAVADARKAITDAEYEQRHFFIERQAKAERVELDADIALRRRHLSQRLDLLAASLAREGGTQKEVHDKITALLKSFGIDYKNSGDALGAQFVTGIKEAEVDAGKAAEALAATANRRLRIIPELPDPEKPKAAGAKGAGAPATSFPTGSIPKSPKIDPVADVAGDIGDAFGKASDKIRGWAGSVGKWIGGVSAAVAGFLRDTGTLDALTKYFDKARTVVEAFYDAVIAVWGAIVTATEYAWSKFGGILIDHVRGAIGPIGKMISGLLTTLDGLAKFVTGVFTLNWGLAWDGVKTAVTGAMSFVVGFLASAWNSIVTGLRLFGQLLLVEAQLIGKGLVALGGLVVDGIAAGVKAAPGAILDAATWVVGGIVDGIKGAVTLLLAADTWIVETIVSGVKALASFVVGLGSWVVEQLVAGVKAMPAALIAMAGWLKERIVSGVKALAVAFVDVGKWIVNRFVEGVKTMAGALGEAAGWIKNRVVEAVQAIPAGFVDVGKWIVNRFVEGIETTTEAIGKAAGWIKNRFVEGIGDVAKGFQSIGKSIVGFIIDGLEGAANKLIGWLNKIIHLIEKIPGVKIDDIPLLARGGSIAKAPGGGAVEVARYATGGQIRRGTKLTAPMVMMGEEAPRHPEFVIPTNPAYRERAVGLYQQLGSELGVQQFREGGILGAVGDAAGPIAGAASVIGKVVKSITSLPGKIASGIAGLLGPLPSPSDLPDFMRGLGTFIIHGVGKWIEDKVGSLFGTGINVKDVDAPNALGRLSAMLKRMDEINAKGYTYAYGGGHNGAFAPSKDIRPGKDGFGYDCSGLVSAILHAGGFLGSPVSTDGLKVFGEGGDGKVITIGVRGSSGLQAHTMMRIGNKYMESGSGHGAQYVGGWSGGFPIHRHPVGFAQGGILARDGILERFMDPNSPLFVGYGLAEGGIVAPAPFVGSYADGGVAPRDGFAYVHQGETITPGNPLDGATVQLIMGGQVIDERIELRIVENDRRRGAMMRAGIA